MLNDYPIAGPTDLSRAAFARVPCEPTPGETRRPGAGG